MMLSPIFENQFNKDIKRLQKCGKDMEKLKIIIKKLTEEQTLDPKYKDHALIVNWKDHLDCHIEPDWLMIYKITETNIIFVRSGSHSDLF
ncbi:MAG: type II toxin-antitoxin system YafQ family toxin [Microcystaceae cyanobacterium]